MFLRQDLTGRRWWIRLHTKYFTRVYLIFIFGLVYFVINPALDSGSFSEALLRGMLFGFITYSTYDLTNLATLEGWPIKITIIDLIWGTSLGGLVSSISHWLAQYI